MAERKGENQKLKMLYIVRLFSRETDDAHKLTMPEIISKLAAEGVNLLIRKMQHEEIQNDQIVLPVAFSKGISSMTDEEYEQYRKETHHDEA